jgi:polyhydroxyalkanoate synthesis repressor PhaR
MVRTIKRYSNRKLYDTTDSRYVTLPQIAGLIRNGDEIRVIDKSTQQDLTAATLAQIIFEEEKKGPRLSIEGLRRIIRSGLPPMPGVPDAPPPAAAPADGGGGAAPPA